MVSDYRTALQDLGFEASSNGIWASVGKPEQEYGWKIHLASVQIQAKDLLTAIAPVLRHYAVPFKCALTAELLGELNEGTFGLTQIGKFATIYPVDDEQAYQLALELVAATRPFSGPAILTDKWLGSVVYTRFGPFSPVRERDRLGNYHDDPDKPRAGYTIPFSPPENVANPFDAPPFDTLVHPHFATSGAELPGYLQVSQIGSSPKGSVLLALDVTSQADLGLVVLKEGRRHCLSDTKGRDIWDRLEHQQRLSQQLGNAFPVPAVLKMFDRGESRFLAFQYIEGTDFSQRRARPFGSASLAEQRKLLADFIALCDSLQALHGRNIVHRDLSPRNVRIDEEGRAWLIDLEMAAEAGALDTLFMQGTAGFISPQQQAGEAARFADDLYSLGCLLVHALTGMDPRRLSLEPDADLSRRLDVLSGAPWRLVTLCTMLLGQTPSSRPGLQQVRHELEQARGELSHAVPSAPRATAGDVLPILRGAVSYLVGGTMRDPVTGMPLSPELASVHQEASLSVPQAYKPYRSASRGVAGVLYTVSRLATLGASIPAATTFANNAADWLLAHFPTDDDQMPGLHFGEAGVALALLEAIDAGLIDSGKWLPPYLDQVFSGAPDWDDLTHGAAGQGLAAMEAARRSGIASLATFAHTCADYLIDRQEKDGRWSWPTGVDGMEGTAYTGFAHGTAGIAYFLTLHAQAFDNGRSLKAAERAIGWLNRQARAGTASDTDWWPREQDGEAAWHWWCHGGPGIALTYLAHYRVTGDPASAQAAHRALAVHPASLRAPNLSQCHGLAGLGEIYLEAWQTLGDIAYLQRAQEIGNVLLALRKGGPDNVYWLVENPFHATADLMIGSAGVAHFLARLFLDQSGRFGPPLAPSRTTLDLMAPSPGDFPAQREQMRSFS